MLTVGDSLDVMSATLTVYLRSYTPVSEPQNEVVKTARTLEVTDQVDDCEVVEWPSCVSRESNQEPVRVLERVSSWADEVDVEVTRPFRVHDRTNPVTDTRESVLHTPVVYVTLERDNDLAGVAPCTLPDGTHVSAHEYLESLAKNEDPFELPPREPLIA